MNSTISGRNTQETNNRNNSVKFQGGQNLGACASGFGTCCLISVSQCDSVITENSTVTVVLAQTDSILMIGKRASKSKNFKEDDQEKDKNDINKSYQLSSDQIQEQ